jgi:hypothetical protein
MPMMASTKERPKGISATALGVILFDLLGLLFVKWSSWSVPLYVFILPVAIALTMIGLLVWFYWTGHNWARWMVMLQVIFPSIIVLVKRSTSRPLLVTIPEGVFGLFLLYWLNTRKIRTFFSN